MPYIPAGKQLIIHHRTGVDIFERYQKVTGKVIKRVPLLISNDISLNLSSSFSQFLGSFGGDSALNGLLSSIAPVREFIGSTQFRQMGLQTWEKTEPISMSLEIQLNMKTDAKSDVFDPAKLLMMLPLPRELDSGNLIAPGPTFFSAIQDAAQAFNIDIPGSGEGGVFTEGDYYAVMIGKTFFLEKAIIRKVTPVFSLNTDTEDYTISCKLSIEIDSMFTATQQMVEQFDSQNTFINGNRR
jgi:hypothetical protein